MPRPNTDAAAALARDFVRALWNKEQGTLTQGAIGKIARVKQSQISNVVTGRGGLGPDAFFRLARYLGRSEEAAAAFDMTELAEEERVPAELQAAISNGAPRSIGAAAAKAMAARGAVLSEPQWDHYIDAIERVSVLLLHLAGSRTGR